MQVNTSLVAKAPRYLVKKAVHLLENLLNEYIEVVDTKTEGYKKICEMAEAMKEALEKFEGNK